MVRRMLTAASLVLALGACRGQTSSEPPIVPLRGMHEMPRYDAQEASRYFEDGRTMRPPVEGTIAREMVIDPAVAEGVDDAGGYVMTIPEDVVRGAGGLDALLERGHSRYDIYCSPCHAYTGDGRGMVTQRAESIGATFAAANLHDDRLRHAPDGQIYATITNGIRTMPAYRAQVPVADRWAIVAYVRALQLSQSDARTAALAPAQGTTETVR
ncbi:c-type cytochrome [Sandaracinus amylolyticus]|uniref:ABC-type Fe3+ transport system protein n=1 Tax=Sandaracinus amylolyticus TaxID=927083 RepID=A0A0F6SF75_9BACT|nr:cytochrome c [Sandaracinus amylolyticus]AKF06454.1 ABC-type Fe3+ transport system protein [Sandaracinus amylolyticus]